MFIENTEARLHHIPVPGHDNLKLLPGVNDVPDAVWAKAKANEMVRTHIDEGNFVELSAKSLEALTIKDAEELVKATLDRNLLDTWSKNEKRPKVAKAIAAQLELVKVGKPSEE